jgi:hypothetical protein
MGMLHEAVWLQADQPHMQKRKLIAVVLCIGLKILRANAALIARRAYRAPRYYLSPLSRLARVERSWKLGENHIIISVSCAPTNSSLLSILEPLYYQHLQKAANAKPTSGEVRPVKHLTRLRTNDGTAGHTRRETPYNFD